MSTVSNRAQGFKNISSEELDDGLKNISVKGPSFVNAEPRDLPSLSLLVKACLQHSINQLKYKNIPKDIMNKFKRGMAGVIEGSKRGSEEVSTVKRFLK